MAIWLLLTESSFVSGLFWRSDLAQWHELPRSRGSVALTAVKTLYYFQDRGPVSPQMKWTWALRAESFPSGFCLVSRLNGWFV